MSASKTTASAILKNVYEGPIVDQINNPNVLLKFIDRNSRDVVEGSKIIGSIRLRPTQGIGARAELTTLPSPGSTRHGAPEDTLKHFYGVMRISGPVMRASEKDVAAFNRVVKTESEGLVLALKLDQQRQVYGTEANDGRICLCGSTTASLTVQLAAGTNMRYFEVGMVVDILTVATGVEITDGTERTIVSIDEENYTITFEGNVVTTTSAAGVFRTGNRNGEINGLEAIISTSTLHGVNPATAGNERWKGNVNSNFGAFSITKFQTEFDKAHNRSGMWVTHILSQEAPRNLYLAELQGQRRIVTQGNEVKLDGGFSGLEYTGGGETAVWFKDPMAPSAQKVYGVRLSELELKQYAEWAFMEMGGEHWFPDIYGSTPMDAWKAVMFKDAQLWAKKRNCHFKLDAVTA
jgi:hypothetical protein